MPLLYRLSLVMVAGWRFCAARHRLLKRGLVGGCCAFLLLLSPFATSQPVVELTDLDADTNLALEMMGLDATDRPDFGLEEALAAPGWVSVPQQDDMLAAPRQTSTLWLKASLANRSDAPIERWLELSPWRLNEADAWLVDPVSGEVISHTATGLDQPVAERSVESARAVVPVMLPAGEQATLLLRLHTQNRHHLIINSWDPINFIQAESARHQWHSVALAVVLTLFAVLVLQFDLRFLLVGLWMLASFVLQADKEGYISYVLFQSFSEYAVNVRFASSVVAKALFLSASVLLLGLQYHRYARRVLIASPIVALLAVGVGFWLDEIQLRQLSLLAHVAFVFIWLTLLPLAMKPSHKWQKLLLLLLFVSWAVASFSLAQYMLEINYAIGFEAFRVAVQVVVILGVLLVYARQKSDHEAFLEAALHQNEQQERQRLEGEVNRRTSELNVALAEARQANTAKTEFLSRVTHDLKSPLTSIMGYSQLLCAEQGKVGSMSQIVYGSAQHMLNMVTRLIDYAQGMTASDAQNDDIYVHSFLASIQHEAEVLAQKNANSFELRTDNELWPVIRCDETFLREILINLIDNACKNTQQGMVRLEVSGKRLHDQGDNRHTPIAKSSINNSIPLTFVVSDTGCGMSEEQQKRLFEPSYRVNSRADGAGLGLPIVNDLVTKLGGTIFLASELGVGTRATVSLTVAEGDEEGNSAFLALPNNVLPQLDARGLQAWVVEDAQAIQQLLAEELESLGFNVTVFDTAECAISAFESSPPNPPNLVITDHRLPNATGDAVLEAAREYDRGVPVILLSATWRLTASQQDANTYGYSACLGKPVDLARLRRSIAHVCQLKLSTPSELSVPKKQSEPVSQSPQLTAEDMRNLSQWVALGAVTDMIEWCDEMLQKYPQLSAYIDDIRQPAERGDFSTVKQQVAVLFEQLDDGLTISASSKLLKPAPA